MLILLNLPTEIRQVSLTLQQPARQPAAELKAWEPQETQLGSPKLPEQVSGQHKDPGQFHFEKSKQNILILLKMKFQNSCSLSNFRMLMFHSDAELLYLFNFGISHGMDIPVSPQPQSYGWCLLMGTPLIDCTLFKTCIL